MKIDVAIHGLMQTQSVVYLVQAIQMQNAKMGKNVSQIFKIADQSGHNLRAVAVQ